MPKFSDKNLRIRKALRERYSSIKHCAKRLEVAAYTLHKILGQRVGMHRDLAERMARGLFEQPESEPADLKRLAALFDDPNQALYGDRWQGVGAPLRDKDWKTQLARKAIKHAHAALEKKHAGWGKKKKPRPMPHPAVCDPERDPKTGRTKAEDMLYYCDEAIVAIDELNGYLTQAITGDRNSHEVLHAADRQTIIWSARNVLRRWSREINHFIDERAQAQEALEEGGTDAEQRIRDLQ